MGSAEGELNRRDVTDSFTFYSCEFAVRSFSTATGDFILFPLGEERNLCVASWGDDSAKQVFAAPAGESEFQAAYCLKTTGGPLTRFPLRLTVTSTRSAILTKGMPLFIP